MGFIPPFLEPSCWEELWRWARREWERGWREEEGKERIEEKDMSRRLEEKEPRAEVEGRGLELVRLGRLLLEVVSLLWGEGEEEERERLRFFFFFCV